MKVGFIGVGNIGAPMAGRFLKAGHELTVYDLAPARVRAMVERGAKAGASSSDVAFRSEVVCLSLHLPEQVEDVVLGTGKVLATLRPGDMLIDLSTNLPDTVRRIAKEAAARRVDFVESPVSGGPYGAEAGTLALMAGGDAPLVEKARRALAPLGTVYHMGPIGSGNTAKLMNNLAGLLNALGALTAIEGARKVGIDPKAMLEVIQASSGGSTMVKAVQRRMAAKPSLGFPDFASPIVLKDLTLAAKLVRQLGMPPDLADWVLRTYEQASKDRS